LLAAILTYAPRATSDEQVAMKLEEYFAWAKEDTRLSGFNP